MLSCLQRQYDNVLGKLMAVTKYLAEDFDVSQPDRIMCTVSVLAKLLKESFNPQGISLSLPD